MSLLLQGLVAAFWNWLSQQGNVLNGLFSAAFKRIKDINKRRITMNKISITLASGDDAMSNKWTQDLARECCTCQKYASSLA